jgi:cobalt-zinc-cadmium efflux system membrane fusion protein
MLEIPPAPGSTVIPRTALVVAEGRYYVFVQSDSPDKFGRREVGVAQEKGNHVVVETGVKAGEHVVSVGGLMLEQIYEDLKTGQTGAPPCSSGDGAD